MRWKDDYELSVRIWKEVVITYLTPCVDI